MLLSIRDLFVDHFSATKSLAGIVVPSHAKQVGKDKARRMAEVHNAVRRECLSSGRDREGGVPTKSMKRGTKRHFTVRGVSVHRTSSSCPQCQQNGLVPKTKDGVQEPNSTKFDQGSCPSCDSAVTAGDEHSDELRKMVMQEDRVACMNICRGGITGMQLRERPHDRQSKEHSLGGSQSKAHPGCYAGVSLGFATM